MSENVHPAAFITLPPRVVMFLCVHNSSRSQMAEGFARALAPAGVVVMSGGTEPGGVNPHAVTVMQESGIDISAQRSQHIDLLPWQDADTVVTLCSEAEVACPVLRTEVRQVHWPLPDPSLAPPERALEVFREVREEIRWRVASLWPRGD
ncbi:MAG: arsenate reductase ArsC [Candidatus Eisenbacteria bacterium]